MRMKFSRQLYIPSRLGSFFTSVWSRFSSVVLSPHIDFEIENINALEKKNRLEPEEQEHLAMHRHNLRILQEMLSGQRPYAPLYLVNSVTVEEQRIQEIDNRLGSL